MLLLICVATQGNSDRTVKLHRIGQCQLRIFSYFVNLTLLKSTVIMKFILPRNLNILMVNKTSLQRFLRKAVDPVLSYFLNNIMTQFSQGIGVHKTLLQLKNIKLCDPRSFPFVPRSEVSLYIRHPFCRQFLKRSFYSLNVKGKFVLLKILTIH